jgi:hypothetical protein
MFAATIAVLLAAQSQAPQASVAEEIVVTAPPAADAATVQRFVQDVSVTTGGQIASFRSPVCPAVFGLPQEYAERLARRVRLVAAQAGMEVAPAGCTPNVTLMVVNNSVRAVEQMQQLNPALFNGLAPGEYRRLTRGDDAVRAWSLIEVRNEDGNDIAPGSSDERGTGAAGGHSSNSVMRVSSVSIMTLPTRRVITQSVIVMEEQAMVGKTLRQIADYVAMRGIAGARAGSAGGEGNSILSLFDAGGSAPRALSSFDLGYLRALRRTHGHDRAQTHMGRIARMISGELASRVDR